MTTNRHQSKTSPTLTVAQLATLSGVSSRTLRFYHDIGLLTPAVIAANGYRHYGQKEQLRLQQIMFYRELGFELAQIKEILDDPAFDVARALRAHREALIAQSKRSQQLIETIDTTLAHIEGEKAMDSQNMYAGFDPAKQAQYEAELVERFGEPAQHHIADSKHRTKNWAAKDFDQVKADYDRIHGQLTALIKRGVGADSNAAQALIAEHYKIVCRFWTPNREAYVGLGQLYLDHADFRKMYDSYCPELAQYMAAAMAIFAETQISHTPSKA